MAKDVVEFDNAVQKLAMEEEPFAGRAQQRMYETTDNRSKQKGSKRGRMNTVDDKRQSP